MNKNSRDLATTMACKPTLWPRWLLIALSLLGSPIAFAADSAEYLREAQTYIDKGDLNAAVIQLKNALLVDPANQTARLLLGKAYLKQNDGPSAEKELRRAQELGAPRDAVLVPLGRALLMSGQSAKLLESISPLAGDSDELQGDILVLRGQAHLATDKIDLADKKFSEALALNPTAVEALLGKARIAFHNQDATASAELVEQALSRDPQNADAWTMKGELLRHAGRLQDAETAFDKAIDLEPDKLTARLGRAAVRLALGETDQAKVDVDWLVQTHPNLSLAHYLQALAHYQQQQLEPAQASVQRALKQAPNHLPIHLLAGTIAYQQQQLNQAEQHLRRYRRSQPDNPQANMLLAATLLKLKQPEKAIEVLEPGLVAAAENAQYLSLLGSAYLQQGDTAKGLDYLEQAVALAPDAAGIRTQLAIGQLAQGDVDQGVSELQNAVDLGPELVQADLLLVMSHLQRKDFDKALSAIDTLDGKLPDSPVPPNFRGVALLGQGDRAAARQAFMVALELQPDFVPTHLNLARLDLLDGNKASAQARYQKVLSYDAGNLKALLALAALADRDSQVDETTQWLKQAHQQHPEAIQPALFLVQHYLKQGETTRAMDLAKTIAVAHPRDPRVLTTLAQVQLKAAQDKAALNTLRTLTEVAPQSAQAHYLLGVVQVKLRDSQAARRSLQRAIQLQADYPAAQLMLGRLSLAAKDDAAAEAIAADLRKAHPEAAFADELMGDVQAARKTYPQAAESYALAYGKTSSAALAQKLYQARLQLGETETAHQALQQWLADHPDDVQTRSLLAQAQISARRPEAALETYRKLVEYDPDNVNALNNLAWLYQQANNPEGIQYAERAYTLSPDRPEVIDTLGWLLVQNGDINRGLVLLQEAASKAPHLPEIRYHMAAALDKAGRRAEARQELDRLLNSDNRFPERDEAEALRKKLGD